MKRIITLVSAIIFSSMGFAQTYISEDFSSFSMPVQPPISSGWKNVDSLNFPNQSDSIWRFDNPGAHTVTAPMAGNIAIVDSDYYGFGNSQDCYLSTPSFDASLATTVLLEFDHYFQAIGASFGEIQIFDGVSWVTDTIFTATTNNPQHEIIDISALAAGNAAAQIRFRYSGSYGWQWALDNVVVFQPTPDDASVVSVDSTVAGCNLTATEQVCATIVNAGSTAITNFPVNFTINGGAIVTETVNATLNPGDSILYCFTTTADFSAVGSYDINVFTSLRNDANNINDTAMGISVNKNIITSYPYNEDFETGNGGWIPEGSNSSWALGAPAGTVINSAGGGVNSYVTNLTGDYNNSEFSYVLGPCFDFTTLNSPQFKMNVWWNSENSWDGALLQMSIDNGVTWTKVGAFLDPNNWYNDNTIGGLQNVGLSGEGWTGNAANIGSNGWVLAEHDLNGAGNQPSVQLRIAFGSDGTVVDEGFAFDDILIQDAPASDGGVVALVAPGSSCGFGTADSVKVAIANFGSAPLVNFPVTYSFNGNPTVTDTVRSTINPGDTAIFTFTQGTVNLSTPGLYPFSIYTDIATDGNILNDSLSTTVENSLKVAPYTENFDLFFTSGTGFNNAGSVLGSGWTSNPTGSPDFFWGARNNATGSGASGPNVDNTGAGGNFIFVEGSNGATGDIAELTSPCIDISALSAARLEFWYHKYGANMGTMYIDIFDGAVWSTIDSIVGQTQTANADPYLLRQLNITSFIGNVIQVRFRSSGKTGFATDMAIDDFRVIEPSSDDVSLIEITAPLSNCGLSTADSVKVLITNVGSATLDTIPVAYETGAFVIIDTSFTTINPGDTIEFTFATTVNFSTPGLYSLVAYTDLATDGDRLRDTSSVQIENSLKLAPYTENFDLMPLGGTVNNGWTNPSSGAYDWRINAGQTTSGGTGPSGDNTTGSTNYVYTEASNGIAGDVAFLESPCIDASSLTAATLEFYYHMLGTEINTLYIEVGNNNGYTLIDSIVGAQQTAITDPFIQWSTSITPFLGAGNISIRFSSTSLGCCAGDISIDDFRIYEPSLTDASVIEITSPSTGCALGTDSVKVLLTNVGLGPINTIPMTYSLNGSFVNDTSFASLNPGDTIEFTFTTPANLSAIGTYNIVAFSDLAADGDRNNDSASTSIDNIPVVSVPYTENFETSNGGWTAYGANSSWTWGAPTGTYITGAGNGTQAWVTNLAGAHNNSEDSYLESPCMDFSGQTTDPVLTYLHIYNTESCCDEGWVELSLDGGVTWTKVIDNGSAVNWYNDVANQYWNGNNVSGSGIWDTTSNVLTGAAGNSDVKIRFAFSSDGSVTEEGFGIDSVSIDIVTSIDKVESSDALAFSIFPNPAVGQFTLIAPSIKGTVNVEILDTKGQLVYNKIVTANDARRNPIDLSENAKGVYFVKISNGDYSRVEKLILQ